jgi:uncharacterized protein YkwD
MNKPVAAACLVLTMICGLASLAPPGLAQSEPGKAKAKPPAPTADSQGKPALQTGYDLTQAPGGHTLRELEFLERYCFTEVNQQREAEHLAPLVRSPELLPVARRYSRQMAEERFFSHTDPQGRTAGNRVREAGIKFSMVGENLSQADGYLDPVPDVVESWMRSPNHRLNILNSEFQYAAVGVWIGDKGTVYFTELFLTR